MMPISRHDPDRTILVRTFGLTFSLRSYRPPRTSRWDQLICATRGMMTVHASDCSWAVPPHRAVWIPSGRDCRLEMHGEVALRIIYLRTGMRLPMSVVNVTPLMRELIARAVSLGALDSSVPAQKRISGVIRDEVKALRSMPLQLPVPKDPRALRFTGLAGANLPLPELLRRSGASRRTMERIFQEETSMSLGRWLRRFQLIRALRLLAGGSSVKEAAREVGYASVSAFIAMFRRELGDTPSRYFDM